MDQSLNSLICNLRIGRTIIKKKKQEVNRCFKLTTEVDLENEFKLS